MHKQVHDSKTVPARGRFQNVRRGAALTAVVALLSLGAVPPMGHAAPADDYTREIMAEGNRMETLGQAHREREKLEKSMAKSRPATPGPRKAKSAPPAAPVPVAAPAPRETDATFETKLRETFPASFALYSLLSPEEKTAVRAEYDQSTNPGVARFHPVVSKIIAFSTKKR